MPVEWIKGPVLLYGAGREARSTRRFLAETAPDVEVHFTLDGGEAEIEDSVFVPLDRLDEAAIAAYPLIVRSAGVSMYKPLIVAARTAGGDVTTNVNLWARHRRGEAKTIAVTGTKGKSTTAKLIHTMLTAGGFDAGLGGNIGVPPLELADHAWQVLELSSFQCADLELNPDFAGITSLFPEHLDWHHSEDRYFADKLNLVAREIPLGYAMSPQAMAHDAVAKLDLGRHTALADLPEDFGPEFEKAVASSPLMGAHNLANARIAARIALAAGVARSAVLDGLARYEPLPHRLQAVTHGGKVFVNDSIATNPEATKAAMAAYPEGRVALAVGGFDRGQNYDDLIDRLPGAPLASIWFLPDTGHRIADTLGREALPYPAHKVESLTDLFARLATEPDSFDVLIMSPGAPSYNQFNNFEERGQAFLDLAARHFG